MLKCVAIKKLTLLLVGLIIFVGLFILGSKSLGKSIHSPRLSINQNKPDYTLVFLGDSMTEALGNFDELRADLKPFYPNKRFLLLNYGFGSTNILSVQDRIVKDSTHSGRIFQPINNIPFDLIFIESFGNNPLSQYSLSDGLKKQTEALDQIVNTLTTAHPKSSIVFVATLAPIRDRYGEGSVNLLTSERQRWADERAAYIKNHIAYAKAHNIPVVDIYDETLGIDGGGEVDYISSADFIHPSPSGIYFISSRLSEFIAGSQLLK